MIELKENMTMAEIAIAKEKNNQRRAAALRTIRESAQSMQDARRIVESCDSLALALEQMQRDRSKS